MAKSGIQEAFHERAHINNNIGLCGEIIAIIELYLTKNHHLQKLDYSSKLIFLTSYLDI